MFLGTQTSVAILITILPTIPFSHRDRPSPQGSDVTTTNLSKPHPTVSFQTLQSKRGDETQSSIRVCCNVLNEWHFVGGGRAPPPVFTRTSQSQTDICNSCSSVLDPSKALTANVTFGFRVTTVCCNQPKPISKRIY